MTTLQIRKLPREIADALKLRAKREHRSLAQQAVVELGRMPEVEGRARRVQILRRIAAEPIVALAIQPEKLIREDRDR